MGSTLAAFRLTGILCSIDRTIIVSFVQLSYKLSNTLYTWTKYELYDILVAKYHSRLHHLLLIKYAKLIMRMYFDLQLQFQTSTV